MDVTTATPPGVPVDRFRELVAGWRAGFGSPEQAYRALAAGSGLSTEAWRKRLTETWLTGEFVPLALVDEFISAAGRPDFWHVELADLATDGGGS